MTEWVERALASWTDPSRSCSLNAFQSSATSHLALVARPRLLAFPWHPPCAWDLRHCSHRIIPFFSLSGYGNVTHGPIGSPRHQESHLHTCLTELHFCGIQWQLWMSTLQCTAQSADNITWLKVRGITSDWIFKTRAYQTGILTATLKV